MTLPLRIINGTAGAVEDVTLKFSSDDGTDVSGAAYSVGLHTDPDAPGGFTDATTAVVKANVVLATIQVGAAAGIAAGDYFASVKVVTGSETVIRTDKDRVIRYK